MKTLNLIIIFASSLFLTACGGGVFDSSSNSLSSTLSPEQRVAKGVVSVNAVVPNFQEKAGLSGEQVSDQVRNLWINQRSLLAEDGHADQITGPMHTAVNNIASEVCDDLLAKEIPLGTQERRFFNNVNFI